MSTMDFLWKLQMFEVSDTGRHPKGLTCSIIVKRRPDIYNSRPSVSEKNMKLTVQEAQIKQDLGTLSHSVVTKRKEPLSCIH